MNAIQRLLAGLGLIAAVGVPLGAIAQTATFGTVHKWTDTATNKTYIYVPGQTAGAEAAGFTTSKAPASRVVTLNNCGWGSFTKSATSPPTNITGANWPATSGSAPTCTKAVAPATGYVNSNDAATGTIIDDGTKIWVKGGTAAGSVTLQITSGGNITTKANPCGFIRVATSESRPMTTFKIGTMDYTLAALPSVTKPMICRKVGTNSFTYVPVN